MYRHPTDFSFGYFNADIRRSGHYFSTTAWRFPVNMSRALSTFAAIENIWDRCKGV